MPPKHPAAELKRLALEGTLVSHEMRAFAARHTALLDRATALLELGPSIFHTALHDGAPVISYPSSFITLDVKPGM